jgi:hypothetical protein
MVHSDELTSDGFANILPDFSPPVWLHLQSSLSRRRISPRKC